MKKNQDSRSSSKSDGVGRLVLSRVTVKNLGVSTGLQTGLASYPSIGCSQRGNSCDCRPPIV